MDYISDENQTYNTDVNDVSDIAVVSALVVVVWTLLANSSIVLCFIINRKTIWSIFSTQVLCLSVTDLFVGLASFPLTILPFLSNTLSHRFCSLLFVMYFASQCASLYQIFGICVHRCIIMNKASSMIMQRSDFRSPFVLMFSSWILSIGVNILLQFLYGSSEVEIKQCKITELFTGNSRRAASFLFIVYFVPFILTNILYLISCLRLRCIWKRVVPTQLIEMNERSNRSTKIPRLVSRALTHGNNISGMSRDNSASIRAQKRVIRTVGSLLLIFNICTIPLLVMFLIEKQHKSIITFRFIVSTMFVLNSAINPFVYAFRTNWLRHMVKQRFREIFKNIR